MDSERPIEKLLRKAAEARRAQADAPQELHPANRRVLQSEVARRFGSASQKRSFLDSLSLFMPRLAWGAAVIVGLGLAASLMLPRRTAAPKEVFFAKNDRTPSLQTADKAKVPSAAPAQPSVLSEELARTKVNETRRNTTGGATSPEIAQADRERDSLSLERQRADSLKDLTLNAPTPQAPAGIGGSLGVAKQKEEPLMQANSATTSPATPLPQENLLQRHYGFGGPAQAPSSSAVSTADASLAASPPPQTRDEATKTELAYRSLPQSAVTTATARAVELRIAAAADNTKRQPAPIARVSQQYVQSQSLKKDADLADKFSVAKPILTSFELQQVGREVRIVDSDGSVYSGSFLTPEGFSDLDSSSAKKGAAVKAVQTAEAQSERKARLYDSRVQTDSSYGFIVTGTNQSLNQIVVFTGQILGPQTNLTLADQSAAANGNRVAPPELNPLPLLNSFISGKVVIGTNKEVEVNAIPAH